MHAFIRKICRHQRNHKDPAVTKGGPATQWSTTARQFWAGSWPRCWVHVVYRRLRGINLAILPRWEGHERPCHQDDSLDIWNIDLEGLFVTHSYEDEEWLANESNLHPLERLLGFLPYRAQEHDFCRGLNFVSPEFSNVNPSHGCRPHIIWGASGTNCASSHPRQLRYLSLWRPETVRLRSCTSLMRFELPPATSSIIVSVRFKDGHKVTQLVDTH